MYQITERIWQGGYPMRDDFTAYWANGVRWLINLDLPYYETRDLEKRGFHVDQPSQKLKGNIHFEEYW